MEVRFVGNSSIVLNVTHDTVLYGAGEFQDNDGEIYAIHCIVVPMLANGKHISVHAKDMEGVTEWRSYDDGKILSFKSERLEYWEYK